MGFKLHSRLSILKSVLNKLSLITIFRFVILKATAKCHLCCAVMSTIFLFFAVQFGSQLLRSNVRNIVSQNVNYTIEIEMCMFRVNTFVPTLHALHFFRLSTLTSIETKKTVKRYFHLSSAAMHAVGMNCRLRCTLSESQDDQQNRSKK